MSSSVDKILRSVPRESGHGISLGVLRDFARQEGLRAFLIKGELADLVNEVGLNRPVLVGLVQRHSVTGVIIGIAALSGPVGWVVIGIGALTAGTGLGFMGSGVTHAVDAVNIHNDTTSDIRPASVR